MKMHSAVIHEITDTPGLCHCSSIAENSEGELVCVWYEGAYETAPDTAIRIAFKPSGADSWLPAEQLFHYSGIPLGNPVLFTFDRQTLYIIFSVLLGESWTESMLFVSASQDGGHSWSNPGLLFAKKGLMAKTKPLRLESGRILIPLYEESGFFPVVLIADDPRQWARSRYTAETMARGAAIQPALAQLPDGNLLMYCRSARGTIWKSLSYNYGLSWSLCTPTGIPNPNSAIDLLRCDASTYLLAFNNSSAHRHSLSVALSRDCGASWVFAGEVDSGDGEYSYPCLLQDRSGRIHLSYTENRYRIKHTVFDLDWLSKYPLEEPLSGE
ncbi:MAG: exo-alpha-sialidase [Spirochaetaceae bacterium]|nr:MAG: exo-alpha-sialidase [Spirochaetaceae bacterium]